MNTDSPSNFRVALDSNFRDVNGNALYPDFDLTPLNQEAELSWNYVDLGEVVSGDALLDYDALVLLLPRFTGESVPSDGKLALVARFGVGYDTVDQEVCNQNGIVLTNTPDAVRRPVAVSIMTLMLALSGKLLSKTVSPEVQIEPGLNVLSIWVWAWWGKPSVLWDSEASPGRCSGWLRSMECSISHMIHLEIRKSIRILM